MNKSKLLIKQIKTIVKDRLKDDSTGHGYYHSYRVVKLALKLGHLEKADLFILELAAWLHDIAVPLGREKHEDNGAKITKQILAKLNVDLKTASQVSNCVLKHRYSRKYKMNTIEEKIISDADNLDALGAIIIPRIFAHCGVHKIPIYDPKIKPNRQIYLSTGRSATGINHIYEKLLDIPNCLYTNSAKQIAKPRIKFLKDFLQQYLDEFNGKK